MSEMALARRYARAFFELSLASQMAEKYQEELLRFEQAGKEVPDLFQLLINEEIPRDKQLAIVTDVARYLDLSQPTIHFIKLLVEKGRLVIFSKINAAYKALVANFAGITDVMVTTALPMTPELATKLESVLQRLTQRDVALHAAVDAKMGAGIVIRIGDTVYDGSLKGELSRIQEQMLSH